jgi:PIN domain nuclease of toxin-antitoxin system
MEYLADTAVIIRYFSEIGKITKNAKLILNNAEQGKHHIYISIISIVEIMYLSEKNRIKIDLTETLNIINGSTNYSIVDLTPQIVLIAQKIKFFELHDRLIIATAKYLNVPMITPDKAIIQSSNVKTIWN